MNDQNFKKISHFLPIELTFALHRLDFRPHFILQRLFDVAAMLFGQNLSSAQNQGWWVDILMELLTVQVAVELLASSVHANAALVSVEAVKALDMLEKAFFVVWIGDCQLVEAAEAGAADEAVVSLGVSLHVLLELVEDESAKIALDAHALVGRHEVVVVLHRGDGSEVLLVRDDVFFLHQRVVLGGNR